MRILVMKKVLKLVVAIILALVIIGGGMFLIDCSRVNSGKEPICCKSIKVYEDGGTIEYLGIGYKIIDFNMLNGYDETKIGSWFMSYNDFEKEFSIYDNNSDGENNDANKVPNKDIVSGDTNISSGEVNISSGETNSNSGDTNLSGDKNEIVEDKDSGDKDQMSNSGDTVSGDNEVKEDKYTFIAVVRGINNKTMIVSPLEDEEIRAISDMISFSIEKLTNITNQIDLIGQKVKVKYTGDIKETYPAQIDILSLEIVE